MDFAGSLLGFAQQPTYPPIRSSPIKSEQVMRLNEDKSSDYSDAIKDFGHSPRTFIEGIRMELIDLGLV